MSRYFDPSDGPPHTRLSIYDADGRVSCVVALDDESTANLSRFLKGLEVETGIRRLGRRSVLDRVLGRVP